MRLLNSDCVKKTLQLKSETEFVDHNSDHIICDQGS